MDPLLAKADAVEEASPDAPPPQRPLPGSEEEVHPLKSLGKGSIITLVGQLVLIAATFGVRVLLVTNLTSALYGDLAVGLAITGILSNAFALGISSAVARQLAHTIDPKKRWKLVVLALQLVVPSAALSGVFLYATAPLWGHIYGNNPDITLVIQFLSVNVAFGLLSGLLVAFFQGNEDAFPNSLFTQIINPTLTVAFMIVFLPTHKNLTTALLAYVASASVTLLGVTLYTLSSRGYPWRKVGALEVVRGKVPVLSRWGLFWFAFPLMWVAVASAADGTADTVVLGIFRSAAVVGAYNSVLPLARLVALAVGALAFIMLPVAARLHRVDDMPELRRSYATITKWIVVITLPFFLTFFFLPGPSLSFVYGSSYLTQSGYGGTPELLQITCLGSLGATLMGPSPSALIGLGRFRELAVFTGVSAVLDAGIAVGLCPFLGSVGAAIANAIATAILPGLCTIETYRVARVHPFSWQMVKPVLTLGVPVGGLLWALNGPLHWSPGRLDLVVLFLAVLGGSFALVALTRSVEMEDGHLLEVAEEYLGRPLLTVRAVGRRFLHQGSSPPPAPSSSASGTESSERAEAR